MQAEQEAAEVASLPKVPRAEITKDEQLGEELPAVPQVRTLLLWKQRSSLHADAALCSPETVGNLFSVVQSKATGLVSNTALLIQSRQLDARVRAD